ncbi:MAG: hypothetical protein IKP77_02565 [Acholeplasmatales bacterium]|nr:hypothetical protein [Acholeplasmatales bacterium]
MKKSCKILAYIVISLLILFTIGSTVFKKIILEPQLEVIEVSDVVRFRDLTYKNYYDNNIIMEVELNFVDIYDSKGNLSSNDYYIYDLFFRKKPLSLNVGDKICVSSYMNPEILGRTDDPKRYYTYWYVKGYLFLCN